MPAVNRTPCDAPECGDATVIQFADRSSRRHSAPPPHSAEPEPVDPVSDRIGAQVQALFAANGRTLTDPATADAMRITMDGVLGLINGALATDVITPEAHQMLMAAFEGIRDVPRTL